VIDKYNEKLVYLAECVIDEFYFVYVYDLINSKPILEYKVDIKAFRYKTAFLYLDDYFNRIIANMVNNLFIW
jgi:hypothetical protein